MTIRIVTDSTCDLPQAVIREYGITVVPIPIMIDSREHQDGIDITRGELYERLPQMRPAPTTAAPGIGVFRQVYSKLAEEGAIQILSIHVSSTLSALYNVARQAAREISTAAVTVVDSRQLSLGMGFQALRAAQAAAEGLSMDVILEILKEQVSRIHTFATLDTLEYLRRSGRMHFTLAALGNLLQIKPFLMMYDGNPTFERVRTYRAARERIIALLTDYHPFERVAVLHAHVSSRAQDLLEEVRSLLPAGDLWVEELNPALGVHLGPGTLGFACLSARKIGG